MHLSSAVVFFTDCTFSMAVNQHSKNHKFWLESTLMCYIFIHLLCCFLCVQVFRLYCLDWYGICYFAEPFYGTICLYNKVKREKLSEDFVFQVLPTAMENVSSRVALYSKPLSISLIIFISNLCSEKKMVIFLILFVVFSPP